MTERAASAEIAAQLLQTIEDCERFLKATGEDFMGKQPSPGNVRGGITTVEEKALGDVLKGGHSPFVEVLAYGQAPSRAGLSFMDTPGNDLASVTGLVAAGCQIVTFTTGRGNPMGNAIAPVVKVTGNAHTWARMGDDIDLDASPIISGAETVEQVGRRIYELVLQVASGERTVAEIMGHAEFAMLRQGVVY
jgi:altronate dehydratase large subunit